jgi:pentatricopeptide repeat protein
VTEADEASDGGAASRRQRKGRKSASQRPAKKSSLSSELQDILKQNRSTKNTTDIARQVLLERAREADTISFNIVLSAYSRQRCFNNRMEPALKADELLSVLLKNPRLKADTYSYSAVLTAYARAGGGQRRAALRAQELLRQMENSGMRIDTDICHNAVINCWGNVKNDKDSGRRARVILTQLEENQQSGRDPQPTIFSYNSCLKALARSGDVEEAQRLLDRMKRMDNPALRPDRISYTTTIDAYCRTASTNVTMAVALVDTLLDEMESNAASNPSVRPDNYAYTSVLSLYAKAGVGTKRAMELLERMKVYASEEPNTTFFNALLNLFAKRGKATEARQLLETMKANDMADKFSYSSTINAFANVGNSSAALTLFDELNKRYELTEDEKYLPTEKSFCIAVFALANGKSSYATPIMEADKLLHKLHQIHNKTKHPELVPTRDIYSMFFLLLSKVKDENAPSRANELLQEMKSQVAMGNKLASPSSAIFAYVINFYTKFKIPSAAAMATKLLEEAERGYEAGDDCLKPTTLLYSAVLQAYAKSASKEGADAAYRLLRRCQKQYEEGRLYAKPTVLFYNAVMDAYARVGGKYALKTESLLDELYRRGLGAGDAELLPTTRSFNAVLLGWRDSNMTDAPQRAEALLKRMTEGGKVPGCEPDPVTFHMIMGAWANSNQTGAADRAEKYLKLFFEGPEPVFPSNPIAYNIAVNAYANSNEPDAAMKAEAVYQRMKERYESGEEELRPSIITLNTLKKCWRKAWSCSKDEKALEKLQQIENLIELERQKKKN